MSRAATQSTNTARSRRPQGATDPRPPEREAQPLPGRAIGVGLRTARPLQPGRDVLAAEP